MTQIPPSTLPDAPNPPAPTPWYKKPVWVVVLTLVAVGVLAGAFGGEDGNNTETDEPVTETATEFDSINDLRNAVEDAGITCNEFSLRDSSELSTSSADCTGSIVLAMHENESDARAQHELRAAMLGAFTDLESRTLIGPNWSVNCDEDDCEVLQEALGGEILVSEAETGAGPATTSDSPTPVAIDLSPDDFIVQLVVLEEQCFDSAGSLITAEPELFTDVEGQGQITITYQVPVDGGVDTYSLDFDSDTGEYSFDQLTLSTSTCNPDLTATVTRVSPG